MNPLATKSTMSRPRQRAIKLLQNVNFGKIDLLVHGGEPIFDPPPRVVETRKLGAAQKGPRSESDLQDFCLKQQVIDLFQTMDEIGDGMFSITVLHGLPFSVEVERNQGR